MFVRKKDHHDRGSAYHQLVESRRVDGVPRQKVVMHLGRHATVDDALKGWPKQIKHLRREADELRRFSANYSEELRQEPHVRDQLRRAANAEQEAEALEAKLSRLKEMRGGGTS